MQAPGNKINAILHQRRIQNPFKHQLFSLKVPSLMFGRVLNIQGSAFFLASSTEPYEPAS